MIRISVALACVGLFAAAASTRTVQAPRYPVVSTMQDRCYDNTSGIACPQPGKPFFGQLSGKSAAASYQDNGDGTVSDRVTGLMWAKAPVQRTTFDDAARLAAASRLGGHSDWRVPTIRELYSLIDFRGGFDRTPARSRPYIDTRVFTFSYGPGEGLGDAAQGQRPIDVQEWSSTRYVGKTLKNVQTIFGVNFADGRIKGYPLMDPANRMQTPNRLNLRLVRGPIYGINDFAVQADTVIDHATGLIWQRRDDGSARTWEEALQYCSSLTLEGRSDWRLPDAKELHTIVDYTRIPAISSSFVLSDPKAYFWTSTTHLEGPPPSDGQPRPFSKAGELAVYFAFGPALGWMEVPPGSGQSDWYDVHGAGAQRSDPKVLSTRFPTGFGPQGDDVRGRNYVRCVADYRSVR